MIVRSQLPLGAPFGSGCLCLSKRPVFVYISPALATSGTPTPRPPAEDAVMRAKWVGRGSPCSISTGATAGAKSPMDGQIQAFVLLRQELLQMYSPGRPTARASHGSNLASPSAHHPRLPRRPHLRVVAALLGSLLVVGIAQAQTNPTPQSLPYTQDFRALTSSSTTYPAGWQGWVNGPVGAAFPTTGPVADQSLIPSATAATATVGVLNYNRKMGMLDNGTTDFGLSFAINTSGFSGVVFGYEIGTVRNPYDGTGNTRIQEIVLQYRVGTSSAWNTVTGTEYQNNTTQQNTGGVTTEQK